MAQPRILFVDDEHLLHSLFDRLFTRKGMEITSCYSAVQAMEELKKSEFDLVVTDFMMPDVDGLELLSHIRQEHPETKVIMITAHANVQHAVRTMQNGAIDYIPKPFKPKELVARVKTRLRRTTESAPERLTIAADATREDEYGDEVALTMARGRVLRGGDLLCADDGTVVVGGHELTEGEYELVLQTATGPGAELAAEAVRYVDPEGRTVDTGLVVALDTTVTPELHAEGVTRDLVRLVQQARRDAGLDVTDRIAELLQAQARGEPAHGVPQCRRDAPAAASLRRHQAAVAQRLDCCGYHLMIDADRGSGYADVFRPEGLQQIVPHRSQRLGAEPAHVTRCVVARKRCEVHERDRAEQPCGLPLLLYGASRAEGG